MLARRTSLVPVLPLLVLCGCAGTSVVDGPAAPGTVGIFVIKRDAATGCWAATTEQWPEQYWGEQATAGCAENDIERYFQRGDDCYHVSGSCGGWADDPAVSLCEPSSESCCGSEDACASE